MKAIDISNFWLPGIVSDYEARQLMGAVKDLGFKRVIAGTQVPSVCYQQLDAASNVGLEIAAYIQMDWSKSVSEQLYNAQYAIDTLRIKDLAITVETPVLSVAGMHFEPKQLTQAFSMARKLGFKNLSIYTNFDNWNRLMHNSEAFRSYPLWYAHYDDLANVNSARAWRVDGFGGWWQPAMKQYAQNVDVAGINADLNEY